MPKQKPAVDARQRPVTVTMDADTRARLGRIQAQVPELASLSATIRFAARIAETWIEDLKAEKGGAA